MASTITALLAMLALLAIPASAQNTTSCDKTLAAEMGTGGGGLMFFLGFMVACVLALLAWFFLIHRPQQIKKQTEPQPNQQSIPVTIQPPPQQGKIYWPNVQAIMQSNIQGGHYYYNPVPNGLLY